VILRGTTANAASSKVIKIGYISSATGVFAPFAEADSFILDQIRTVLAKGITNGGVSDRWIDAYSGQTNVVC
jgi:branched-chain amino acid transport system substrate-binding protein